MTKFGGVCCSPGVRINSEVPLQCTMVGGRALDHKWAREAIEMLSQKRKE